MAPTQKRESRGNENQDGNLRHEQFALAQAIANHDAADDEGEGLINLLIQADDHVERLHRPSDQVIAASNFNQIVKQGHDKVTSHLRQSKGTKPSELVKVLKHKCSKDGPNGARVFDWVGMGCQALMWFSCEGAAFLECMYGAVEPPVVKPTQTKLTQAGQKERKRKEPPGPMLRPEELDAVKQDDTNETSKLTEAMFERVETHSGAPYTWFVLDHESFAQTVENVFSISVLVSSAKVTLRTDEQWGTRVEVAKKSTLQKGERGGQASQMILNINYTAWEHMKRAVAREQCLTPHRDPIDLSFMHRPMKAARCAA